MTDEAEQTCDGSGNLLDHVRTTRRGLLIGGGSVLASTGLAQAGDGKDIRYWFEYDTDAKRETVRLIELRTPRPLPDGFDLVRSASVPATDVCRLASRSDMRVIFSWRRAQFGNNSQFVIEPNADVEPTADRLQMVVLTVRDAQFPGTRPAVFKLILSRTGTQAAWLVHAEVGAWWADGKMRESGPQSVDAFAADTRLSFGIPGPQTAALAKSLFGDRLQIGAVPKRPPNAVLSVDRTFGWRITAPGHKLFVLHTALAFTILSFRTMQLDAAGIAPAASSIDAKSALDGASTDEQASAYFSGRPPAADGSDNVLTLIDRFATSRLGTRQAPSKTALVGIADGIVDFGDDVIETAAAREKPEKKMALRLGTIATEGQRSTARIVFEGDQTAVAATFDAALAQFGNPQLTIAVLRTRRAASARNSGTAIGRLYVDSIENGRVIEEGPFWVADLQMARQARADGRVVTQFLLSAAQKERRARTELAEMDVGALPPVQRNPASTARTPGFEVVTSDRDDERTIERFEGRLALSSLAIALPERFDDEVVAPRISAALPHAGQKASAAAASSEKKAALDTKRAPSPRTLGAGGSTAGTSAAHAPGHTARLDFAGAEVLLYLPLIASEPRGNVDAAIPIGAFPKALVDTHYVQFSLSHAGLRVTRPVDLLSLKYRFAGLALNLPARASTHLRPFIAPFGGVSSARAQATTPDRSGRAPDERPMMVVEFPPQHVAEQAFFRRKSLPLDLPKLTPKPGLSADEKRKFGDDLEILRRPKEWRNRDGKVTTRDERKKARKDLQAAANATATFELDGRPPTNPTLQMFLDTFSQAVKDANAAAKDAGQRPLPKEQQIYCGSEFLDPDTRRIALESLRRLQVKSLPGDADVAEFAPDVTLDPNVVLAILRRNGVDDLEVKPTGDKSYFPLLVTEELARKLPWDRYRAAFEEIEREKERRDASYADFRRRFASAMRDEKNTISDSEIQDKVSYRGRRWYRSLVTSTSPILKSGNAGKVLETVRAAVEGDDEPFAPRAEARLAGPSRIAFRINPDDFEPTRVGGRIPFSLEDITNWGSMDMAVVRRAERLVQSNGSRLLPRWQRVMSADAGDILRFQRISSDGEVIRKDKARPSLIERKRRALDRLGEVYARAKDPPDAFETALELPFRLFLSPAQDATWKTPSQNVWRRAFSDPAQYDPSRKPTGDPRQECGEQEKTVELFREVWTARLSGAEDSAGVRAVWSPDFRPDALLSTSAPGAPLRGPYAPWSMPRNLGIRTPPDPQELGKLTKLRLPMDAYDRHELVVLSSVYGLPVIGRRLESGNLVQFKDSSQVEPPPGFRLNDVAKEKGEDDNTEIDRTSIYWPRALSVSELSLSALGGSINLDTHFVPPAPARLRARNKDELPTNLFDAFSIERWRQRSVMGRDVSVEVVYKGFLFPIGHRASLVKLTERRFESRGPHAPPVAYLVQRMFLRVGDPIKTFPAYDHPNRGRRFPADKITILTRRTPDIVDPTDAPAPQPGQSSVHRSGRIWPMKIGTEQTGLVFWPRTSPREGSEVLFEMQVGAESVPVRIPLVFVDLVAANDEPTVRSLVEYYNGLNSEATPGRRLTRLGQPVKMAPETKAGDTTFETEWWDLKAEGRASGVMPANANTVDNRNFTRNSFMEGLDQAPFYPLVDVARIRLTQVERFTGSGPVWGLTSYSARYTRNGFGDEPDVIQDKSSTADDGNADEVYLLLLPKYNSVDQPPIKQSMRDRGDLAGGLAHPDLDIVGLSRRYGPYGSKQRPTGGPTSNATPAPAATPTPAAASPYNPPPTLPTLAGDNKSFDATSLFPDNARILGLVKLSDILKFVPELLGEQAPRLLETLEYGAAAAGQAADGIRAVLVDTVIRPARQVVDRIRGQWETVARREASVAGQSFSLDQAYPDVGRDLKALEDALEKAQAPDATDADFFSQLPVVYEVGRRLIRTIDRIGRDPFAAASEKQLGGVRALKDQFDKLQAAVSGTLKQDLPKAIFSWIREYLRKPEAKAFRALFVSIPRNAKDTLIPATADAGKIRAQIDDAIDACVKEALEEGLDRLLQTPPADLAAFEKSVVEGFRTQLDSEIARAGSTLQDNLTALRKTFTGDATPFDERIVFDVIATPFTRKAAEAFVAIARTQLELEAARSASPLEKAGIALRALPRLMPLFEIVGLSLTFGGISATCASARSTLAGLLDKLVPNEKTVSDLAECAGVIFDARGDNTGVCANAAAKAFSSQAVAALKALEALGANLADARRNFGEAANAVAIAIMRFDDAYAVFKDSLGGSTCFDLPDVRALRTLKDAQAALVRAIANLQAKITASTEAISKELENLPNPTLARNALEQLLKSTITGRTVTQAVSLFYYETDNAAKAVLDPISKAINELAALVRQQAPGANETADALNKFADEISKIRETAPLTPQSAQDLSKQLKDAGDSIAKATGNDARKGAQVAAAALQKASEQARAQFEAVASQIVEQIEARLFELLQKLLFAAVSAANDDVKLLVPALGDFSKATVKIYDSLVKVRNDAEDLIEKDPAAKRFADGLAAVLNVRSLLRVPIENAVKPEQLEAEQALVSKIDKALRGADTFVSLQEAYISALQLGKMLERPAILELLRRFESLNAASLKLAVIQALDLRQVREDMEKLLSNLIPTRVTLSYDLDSAVGPFAGIFLPAKDARLTVTMRATADLRASNPTPLVTINAQMGAFDVSLLGGVFEAVILQFRGLSFSGGSQRDNSFKVDFAQVAVGKDAQFLQQLQSYLSPSGDGPFVRAVAEFPGIEAGYGLNLGTFGVGALSFSNVTLNASARLPFQNTTAQFVVSIGRPDAPFLISSTIFGGGGYLALIGSAQGFIGLEASFDYGGVFAFGFGPLVGAGQVTFGVYFRAVRGESPTLGTNFMIRGAATVCGFGIAASLLVRLTMQSGQMQGMAEFTFTFSFYVGDISYRVKVQNNQGARMGARDNNGNDQSQEGRSVAVWPSPVPRPADLAWTSIDACNFHGETRGHIDIVTVSRSKDWFLHQTYYDDKLSSPLFH